MCKHRQRQDAFPFVIRGIALAGLLSALIDGTLGWEALMHTIMVQAMQ